VDKDPCAAYVWWSAITAAVPESAVAGLLAGFLIAAVAALLAQVYWGSELALFCSGVPILAFSAILFTVIAGARPSEKIDYQTRGSYGDTLCSVLWSQWLLAISSLFIGSAVLLCGLGLVLVSYADNLAVKLCETNRPIYTVENSRRILIRVNAWLSAAVTTVVTALLIAANATYLMAIGRENLRFKILGEDGYVLFFVYLFGLYLIGRSLFVVFERTRSALRANIASCAAYAAGFSPVDADNEGLRAGVGPVRPPAAKDPGFARRKKVAMRAAQEFAVVIWVALSALLAAYLASGEPFNNLRQGITVSPEIVIYIVVAYIIFRAAYVLIANIVERVSAKKDDNPTNNRFIPPEDAGSVERIRITYNYGRLFPTISSVLLLAILGAFFFVAGLMQGPLWPAPRITISLLLGGLYPAVILAGLSSSVPAAEDVRRPRGETLRRLAFIP
jgi:hypothetical protein